ncbi:uncharacterized protein LOC111709938 isoform X2 [Eurytemora carolleeae]|nr:uncharacterized protein LOC111709938 isoform X2 [Eurytemora carolleeae]|eukprot:XP_023339680.1 uncharacterized protein LOC111709938 isoform X2 [Eurytemora affinis]
MYDKRWVIENILAVGRHFQTTSYITEDGPRELDDTIEEKMMTLWDISVEEDVSKFYLDYGVLDFFIELFSNPNLRVKEISIGIMTNMVFHESLFPTIMETDKCLENCLKLLEEKDSPTLLIVFRCLHSYGYNLFNLINKNEDSQKEVAKSLLEKFLIFLSLHSVVQNIGMVMGSCTNKTVLQNCARFLSILSELWDFHEDRRKVSHHYTGEQFLQCALEGMKECVGEDKTEKHFMIFLYLLFQRDLEKDMYSSISTQTICIMERLLKEHVLEYSSIDEHDLEFIFNISYVLKCCLESGEFSSIPANLKSFLKDAEGRVERADIDEEHAENKKSILTLISLSFNFLETCNQNGNTSESTENTPVHNNSTRNFYLNFEFYL